MVKHLFILVFISIIAANNCGAQRTQKFKISTQQNHDKKEDAAPVAVRQTAKAKPKPKGTVKITTNEDCTLKIGDTDYGKLKKDESTSISLPVGTYKLVATNSNNYDLFSADLNVKSNQSTFLIDLAHIQAIRDEKLKSLESLKNTANVYTHENNVAEPVKAEPVHKKAATEAPAEEEGNEKVKATVQELLSNMVAVSGGVFVMGNNVGRNDESPEHTVTIRRVKFGKYEVTQQQWERIMGTNPSMNKGCDKCPVENISWEEVNSFLIKINQAGNKKFRLPTEAEWEYIAKVGGGPKELKTIAWYGNNAGNNTHPAGSLSSNAFGIYDLFGNVAEWCSDWYQSNSYKSKSEDNPAGPVSGKDKVVRGGSFDDMGAAFRPSYRDKLNPSSRKKTIGFRLVMEEN